MKAKIISRRTDPVFCGTHIKIVFSFILFFQLTGIKGVHAQTSQYASSVISYSTQYGTSNWAATQAMGAPNSKGEGINTGCHDFETAWASYSADGQREFLELGFTKIQKVSVITIYEIYNPGAIDTVYLRNSSNGKWNSIYTATASVASPCPRNFTIDITKTAYNVDAIRLAINSPLVSGWNEIDAVMIADGKITPEVAPVKKDNDAGQSGKSSKEDSKNSSTDPAQNNTNVMQPVSSANEGKVVYSYTKNGPAITECNCKNNPPKELWVSIPLPERALFDYDDIQVEIYTNKPYPSGDGKEIINENQQEFVSSQSHWSSASASIPKSNMRNLDLQILNPNNYRKNYEHYLGEFSLGYNRFDQSDLCTSIKDYDLYFRVIGYKMTGSKQVLRQRGSYEKYYETVTTWDNGTLLLDQSNKLHVIADAELGKKEIRGAKESHLIGMGCVWAGIGILVVPAIIYKIIHPGK